MMLGDLQPSGPETWTLAVGEQPGIEKRLQMVSESHLGSVPRRSQYWRLGEGAAQQHGQCWQETHFPG
jgi:hypothetical protein